MISQPETIDVACAIIEHEGKYLIAQRKAGAHLELLWEFPGGRLEQGETLEACLVRELKEELGIMVTVGLQRYTIHHAYSDRQVKLHFFDCAIERGNPKARDCREFKWVLPRELGTLRFPPADDIVIRELMHQRSREET